MMTILMTDRCSPDQRDKFFSLCIGDFDLGIAIAGPTFGLIAQQLGYIVIPNKNGILFQPFSLSQQENLVSI